MRAALAAGTGFNDSVGECHAAAVTLLAHLGRSQSPALLGEVSPEEYQQHKAVLGALLGFFICGQSHPPHAVVAALLRRQLQACDAPLR